MTEEDEAFNEIERRAKQRMEAVRAAMRVEDDDIQEYKKPWVGLTDEEIKEFDTWHDNREEEVGWCNPSEIVAYIEAKLKEKNT